MLRAWKGWILIYDFVMNLLIDHVFDIYFLKVSNLNEIFLKPSWNLAWVIVRIPGRVVESLDFPETASNPTLPKTFDKKNPENFCTSWWKHKKIQPIDKGKSSEPTKQLCLWIQMLVGSGGVSSKKRWQDLGSHALVRPSNCPRVTDKSSCILSRILNFETERCICGSSKQHVPVSTKTSNRRRSWNIFIILYFY